MGATETAEIPAPITVNGHPVVAAVAAPLPTGRTHVVACALPRGFAVWDWHPATSLGWSGALYADPMTAKAAAHARLGSEVTHG